MASRSSNRAAVPEAKGALDKFKYEVASELGVPLSDGYNGDLTSRQNGSVGGYMVKKIVSEQPLNFSSIFYIIPGVIVNYRTTFLTNQRGYRQCTLYIAVSPLIYSTIIHNFLFHFNFSDI